MSPTARTYVCGQAIYVMVEDNDGLQTAELLELAALAYADIPVLCQGARLPPSSGVPEITQLQDISSPVFDVDAFMARCPKRQGVDLVVAVRGTESWADIVQDLKVCKSGNVDTSCLTRVHCGFLAQAYALLDRVHDTIAEIGAAADDDGPVEVWLTGHSLGGAVVTLLAYMLCYLKGVEEADAILHVCTFGSPRVGNYWFRTAFNALENIHTTRVCTARDVIGCLPCMNYFHVGTPLLLADKDHSGGRRGCCPRLRAPLAFSAHKLSHYRRALRDVAAS